MTNIKSLVFFTGRNRDLMIVNSDDGENADCDGDRGENADGDGGDDDDDLGTLSPMALSKHFMAAPMAVTSWYALVFSVDRLT